MNNDPKVNFPLQYRVLSELPTISNGCFTNISNRTNIFINIKQKDLNLNDNRNILNQYIFVNDTIIPAYSSIQNDILVNLPSPSGKLLLIIRKSQNKSKNSDSKCYTFDIIKDGTIIRSVSTEGKHGDIYKSGIIGGVMWSKDEKKIVYMAEQKTVERKEFVYNTNSMKEESEQKCEIGTKYFYESHLGEQLSMAKRPCPYVLDIEKAVIKQVDGIEKGMIYGQPCWDPNDDGIILVGWKYEDRALGLLHYNSRKCKLYYLQNNQLIALTHENVDHSPMCPRFSPNGKFLAFVTTDDVWYHCSGSRLRVLDWESKTIKTIVDIEHDEVIPFEKFPGLWCGHGGMGLIHPKIWLNNNCIVLDSLWRSVSKLILINIENQEVKEVQLPENINYHSKSSIRVLDTHHDQVLITISSLFETPSVFLLSDVEKNVSAQLIWQSTKINELIPSSNEEEDVNIINMIKKVMEKASWQMVYPSNNDTNFEGILLIPTCNENEKVPLILFPHGGPHSAFDTSFSSSLLFLLSTKVAILLCNYRGSRGFGQNALQSLPGKCGTQDVKDCMDLLNAALDMNCFDKSRITVFGGSHGGFLAAHLIGQYPNTFQYAAVRNPVVNLPYTSVSSDIPDWSYIEAGLSFSNHQYPTADQYNQLFDMSPIKYISQIKTPLLMLLGDKDRRVPYHQGIEFIRLLASNNVKTSLIIYPDNQHSLADSVATEADSLIQSALWLHGIDINNNED